MRGSSSTDERRDTCVASGADAVGVAGRREEPDGHRAAAEPRHLVGGERRHVEHDVGTGEHVAGARAGSDGCVVGVADEGVPTGTGLDDHLEARLDQARHRLGDGRDPALAGARLCGNDHLHGPQPSEDHPGGSHRPAERSAHEVNGVCVILWSGARHQTAPRERCAQ